MLYNFPTEFVRISRRKATVYYKRGKILDFTVDFRQFNKVSRQK